MLGGSAGNGTIALASQPMPRRSAVLPRGSRHVRVVALDTWRSRLVVRSDAGDDPDEFRDAGGDPAGGDRWPAARVAAALASAGHLGRGELAAGIVLGTTGSARLQARTRRLPGRKLDAGLAGGRLRRSGRVRISSYFRIL